MTDDGFYNIFVNTDECILIYTILLYYCKNMMTPDYAIPHRYFLKLCKILLSENGGLIIQLFKKYEALTIPEIKRVTGLINSSVVYVLSVFLDVGMIEQKTRVMPPYSQSDGGAWPRIYSIVGTAPENLLEAQRRYAEGSRDRKTQVPQVDPVVEKARRDALITQVIEDLGVPPDKMTPVLEAMRLAEVPSNDHLYVKNGVMAWMHREASK